MESGRTAPIPESARRMPTRGRVLIVAAGFCVLLVASALLTTLVARDRIEAQLRAAATAAINALPRNGDSRDTGRWEIAFDGRDATLRGEIYDRARRDAIVARVRAVRGVRVVDAAALDLRPMDDPWIAVRIDAEEMTLTAGGLLPEGDEWTTRALKELRGIAPPGTARHAAALDVLADWHVDNRIETRADVRAPRWIDGLGPLLADLVATPRPRELTVRDGAITIDGDVYSAAARDAMGIAAVAAFRGAGLAIANDLRVVPPPSPPALSLAWNADGAVTLAGVVADAAAKERLESAIGGGLAPDKRFTSALAVGDNISAASWEDAVVVVAPGLVTDTMSGTFSVDDRRVVRVAGAVTSEEMRESLRQLAARAFPTGGGYALDIALRVEIPPRPAIMSVIHVVGAGAILKGVVGDRATRDAIAALARERLPAGVPCDIAQIAIDAHTLPPIWIEAFGAILPGFIANTTRGGLTVRENALVIEAEVPTETNRDALWQLSENHFPDPQFTRTLRIKLVDPSLPPPPPR